MQNFTLVNKQSLQTIVNGGATVKFVAYNPNTVVGSPETAPAAQGYAVYYREDTANLIEIIYLIGNGYGSSPSAPGFSLPSPGAMFFNQTDLTYPGSTLWAPGTNDFTIEWYQNQTAGSTYPRIFSINVWPNASIGVSIESDGTEFFLWVNGQAVINFGLTSIYNTDHHFAITRHVGHFNVYQDGILIQSAVDNGVNISNSSSDLVIGNEASEEIPAAFAGTINNFRFVNGTAVYTSNFAPPGPLSAITNTVLLLKALTAPNVALDSSSYNNIATNHGVTWVAV